VQAGETLEILVHGIGRMSVDVEDPLERSRQRGSCMGADSTNSDAVRPDRPPAAHPSREAT
jgi:hypothetical protein